MNRHIRPTCLRNAHVAGTTLLSNTDDSRNGNRKITERIQLRYLRLSQVRMPLTVQGHLLFGCAFDGHRDERDVGIGRLLRLFRPRRAQIAEHHTPVARHLIRSGHRRRCCRRLQRKRVGQVGRTRVGPRRRRAGRHCRSGCVGREGKVRTGAVGEHCFGALRATEAAVGG